MCSTCKVLWETNSVSENAAAFLKLNSSIAPVLLQKWSVVISHLAMQVVCWQVYLASPAMLVCKEAARNSSCNS